LYAGLTLGGTRTQLGLQPQTGPVADELLRLTPPKLGNEQQYRPPGL